MKIDEKPFEIKAGCKEPEECTKDFCKNGGVCQQDRISIRTDHLNPKSKIIGLI